MSFFKRGFEIFGRIATPWVAALTLSACSAGELLKGPGYDIDALKIDAYARNQTDVVRSVSVLAGLGGAEPRTPEEWRQFVVAGIGYSDRQCEAYMNALFWFNRAK